MKKTLTQKLGLSKLLLVSITFVLLNACQKDEQVTKTSIDEAAFKKAKNITDLGYNSLDEMLKSGWSRAKNVTIKKQNTLGRAAVVKEERYATKLERKLTFKDLSDLGFSEHRLRSMIKDIKKVDPEGLAINSENRFSGVTPTTIERYSQYMAYVKTGKPKITIVDNETIPSKILFTTTVYNDTDSPSKQYIKRTITTGTTTEWNVTSSAKIGIEGKIGIPLIAETSINVELGLTAGGGGSRSRTESNEIQAEFEVPPHHKMKVVVLNAEQNSTVKYEIPFHISGYIGTNYTHKVDGHWFWFYHLPTLLGSESKPLEKGVVTSNKAYDIQIIAQKPEKL